MRGVGSPRGLSVFMSPGFHISKAGKTFEGFLVELSNAHKHKGVP